MSFFFLAHPVARYGVYFIDENALIRNIQYKLHNYTIYH